MLQVGATGINQPINQPINHDVSESADQAVSLAIDSFYGDARLESRSTNQSFSLRLWITSISPVGAMIVI
jgi:hypothetical protein